MTTVQAAILGLVQGVTEFLPVSSSGHLVLVRQFMGLFYLLSLGLLVVALQVSGKL